MPDVGLFDDVPDDQPAVGKGLFDDVPEDKPTVGTGLFDNIPDDPAPVEAGRETSVEQAGGPGRYALGKVLHPIKAAETGVEQFAISTGLAAPGSRLLWSPARQMETPMFKAIPRTGPIPLPKEPGLARTGAQIARAVTGATNIAVDFINFMQTPEGLASLGLAKIPRYLSRLILGDWATEMARQTPEQLQASIEAFKSGDIQGGIEHAGGGLAGTLLPVAIAKHIGEPAAPGLRRVTAPIEPLEVVERRGAPEVKLLPAPSEGPTIDIKAETVTPTAEPVTPPVETGPNIDTMDLTDKKVTGPGGQTGLVTWSGIGLVEVDTGTGAPVQWRKADLDRTRLLQDYPELTKPVTQKIVTGTEETAPDIIDNLKAHVGEEKIISGAGMRELDPNFPKNGFELNKTGWPKWFKNLFTYKGGTHPSDLVDSLQREGTHMGLQSGDDFTTELFKAFEQRRSGKKVATREAKTLATEEAEAIAAGRKAQIEEVQFENEERAAIAEADKLGAKAKVVDTLPSEGEPFARAIPTNQNIATIAKDGTVLINRPVLNEWLRAVDPAKRAEAVRMLIHEEFVHDRVRRTVGDAGAEQYFRNATALEQALVRRRYGGPAEGRPAFTDAQLGHEMIRARIQQLAGMTPREVFGLRGAERLTTRTILALERIIAAVRRAFGTNASDLQRKMLKRVQDNLDAAKSGQQGLPPAAFLRRRPREEEVRITKTPVAFSNYTLEDFQKLARIYATGPDRLDSRLVMPDGTEFYVPAIKAPSGVFRSTPMTVIEQAFGAYRDRGAPEAPAAFLRRAGELPLEEAKPGEERKGPKLPAAVPFESLSKEARRDALRRTTVTPADIDRRAPDVHRPISVEESTDIKRLSSVLTEGARVRTATPSVTRRVTAVENTQTGNVDLVSTFKEHGITMLLDPGRAGLRKPHVRLSELLSRPQYRILDSYLLEQPVKDFRQRFDTVEQYYAQFRKDVAAEAQSRVRGIEERPAGVEAGRPVAVEAPSQPGVFEAGEPLADAEAGSLYEHLYDTVGKLENAQDVQLALDDLRDKPNRVVASAYNKIYSAIRAANPELSPEQAFDRLLTDVYQNASQAANRQAFVARALERNKAVVPGAVRTVAEGPEAASAAQELEPPAAFWRDQSKKRKYLADRLIGEPFSLYSEWMTDRIARLGGPIAKQFVGTINRIIDRAKLLSGQLHSDYIDAARREAGKPGRATTWFHSFAEKPTAHTAIRNVAPALEGTITVPAFAQRLRGLADRANRAIGQMYVGVSRLTTPGGLFQRNLTGLGYDIIRQGRGDMWDRWAEGLDAANGYAAGTAKRFFTNWKAILDKPGLDQAAYERVNQDFARQYPKAITDVKDPLGNWQSVVHSNLFDYLENAAQRAAHTRAFREVFPNTVAGRTALARSMEEVRADTPGQAHTALDGLMRTIMGHPTDDYSRAGLLHPSSGIGSLFRYLNSTLGNLAAKAVLTGQMRTQAGETLVGGASVFFGQKRYLTALARLKQLYPQLEREGKRNAVMYDWSFDPHSPVRSAFRIAGNTLSKGFAEQFLNEVQEGADAATAKIISDDIASGNLSAWDRRVLPQTFRAMGFTRQEAARMMAGQAPQLLEQMQRRAAAFLSGGNRAIAEGSVVGANRLVNSIFRFQSYPMMKMNQLRKVLGGWSEAMQRGSTRERIASSELLARFMFGTTMQGALTVAINALMTGGIAALLIRKKEAEDEPFKFLAETPLATMGGPLYMVWRGARDKGVKGIGEQAERMFFPYAMTKELDDMANGYGKYEDQDITTRIGTFLRQTTPGIETVRLGLSIAGLSRSDPATEQAIRAFRRFQREQPGYREMGDLLQDDERGKFRTQMRKAVAAIQANDSGALAEAIAGARLEATLAPGKKLSAEQRIAESLQRKQILKTPAGSHYFDADWTVTEPEAYQKLVDRIGQDAVGRLIAYDAMLREVEKAAFSTATP